MHKRLWHYEMHDDDSYEMLFTGYLSIDLYYVRTNHGIMQGCKDHKLLHFVQSYFHQGLHSLALSPQGIDFCLPDK